MKKSMMSTHRLLHMGTAVGLALVCLALLLGLGLNAALEAQAGAAQGVTATTAALGQPQIGTMATTATATAVGVASFSGTRTFLSGETGGLVNVVGTARVTTTINLTTSSSTPITVTVTGRITPTVSEPLDTIVVVNGDYASGFIDVDGTIDVNVSATVGPGGSVVTITEDIPVAGVVGVTNVSAPTTVTATGTGPVSGQGDLTASEPQAQFRFFMPIVYKTATTVGYYDDFSSSSSGWPVQNVDGCKYEYRDSNYYRVTVSKQKRCWVPGFPVPPAKDGTFSTRVRRTTSDSLGLMYGFWFGQQGSNAQANSWGFTVNPGKDGQGDQSASSWLWADVSYDRKYYKTDWIDDDEVDGNDWNVLKIVRSGNNVKSYVNDHLIREANESYNTANPGYFGLLIDNWTSSEIRVEFDYFSVQP